MNTIESIPTTNPSPSITRYGLNDTVSFRFNCDLHGEDIFVGTIIDIKDSKILGLMYRIQPNADERLAILDPVWLKAEQIDGEAVNVRYDEQAAVTAVNAAYLAWEKAYLNPDMDRQEVARLNMVHQKLADAHHARMFPGVKNPARIATFEERMARRFYEPKPEWATPFDAVPEVSVSEAKREWDENVHPLRQTQPGAATYGTDWNAVKAKRDQQYADTKARIEAENGAYQHQSKQPIQMHDATYLSSIFKTAK